MKPETININARYYLAPSRVPNADEAAFDVIDRALEYNHRPAVVFSNGTEKECRELRGAEGLHTHWKAVGNWRDSRNGDNARCPSL